MDHFPQAVVCGKFEPFHCEHLDYVQAALQVADRVIIGITNPDSSYVRHEDLDPVRSSSEANVATYYERYLMVKESLADEDISLARFDIVPFPINTPSYWDSYLPKEVPILVTMYDDDPWLVRRKALLEESGRPVSVLWSKPAKGITGADIRRRIREGAEWRQLVPSATARVIEQYGIDRRIMHERGSST